MRTNGMEQAYALHRKVYGGAHQSRLLDQLCEECAELIVAVQHFRRGRHGIRNVIAEYADVIVSAGALLDTSELQEELRITVNLAVEQLKIRLYELELAQHVADGGADMIFRR